jgi:hypothetical protein
MHDDQRSQFGFRSFVFFALDVLWSQTYHAALQKTELSRIEIVDTVFTLGRWYIATPTTCRDGRITLYQSFFKR